MLINCYTQLNQAALNRVISLLLKGLMMVIKANGAHVEFRRTNHMC